MWDVFQQHIREILPEIADSVLESLDVPQFPAIRFNSSKTIHASLSGQIVPWEKKGVQLNEPTSFITDPDWHAGAYYVQESSSMFLGYILANIATTDSPVKALDLCAAPGGKSTHLLDILPQNSLLVSNEILPKRNAILRENLIRWGKPNIVVTQNAPEDFNGLENYFDIVVIDAPCSGEGLFRRDKKAINEWSVANVDMCALRQKDILVSAMPLVKENGFLIYSTCTFEPKENEEQVQFLLENGFEIVPIDAGEFTEIETGSLPDTFRFYPHKTSGSGLFMACLKKVNSHEPRATRVTSKNRGRKNLPIEEIKWNAGNWINTPEKYSVFQTPYALHAFPKAYTSELLHVNRHLHITYFGTELGEIKKEIFTPAHALALSSIVKKDLPAVEVDKENALKYLRKLPLTIPHPETLGWKVVKYKGLNLGWVKVLQDRINNYLPNNWRILH